MTDWDVDEQDEGTHTPGDELMWNESWYADFVTADGGFGGYLRLGLSPQQGSAWFLLALAGPGRPTVVIDDQKSPLPGADLTTATDRHAFGLEVLEPLRRWRVHGTGTGSSFADGAAVLAGGPGADCPVALDLTWTTDGEAYRYPVGTRYEIPCWVDGSVRVGDEVLEVRGAVGQRDHSWGVRDWGGASWCWSAARLDDGTRTHLTQIALPGIELSLGYVQQGGRTSPMTESEAEHVLGTDGTPYGSRLLLRPDGADALALEVDVLASAPTTVPSSSGLPQPFHRSLAAFRSPDGRHGLGWVEWNGITPSTSTPSSYEEQA